MIKAIPTTEFYPVDLQHVNFIALLLRYLFNLYRTKHKKKFTYIYKILNMCFPKPMYPHKIKMTSQTFINLISTDCPNYRANPLLSVVTQGGMAESLGIVQGYIFLAIDLDFAALYFQLASSLLVFWGFFTITCSLLR